MKDLGLTIKFCDTIKQNARRNLVLSGGKEMLDIVACLLGYYFWVGHARKTHSSITDAIDYLIKTDPACYRQDGFNDLASLYRSKVSTLLLRMMAKFLLITQH